ncbi:MAG: 30S ribosomal protein S6 [Chlamydiae bacterium]|jgi:small subunit ribosomal protein S6|nr:30S ribosomal protein S6 [Chlamydiota bacterium]
MSEKKKNLYEGMYILNATLSEDARQKALEKITSGIVETGGEIVKIHEQGRRRLAYEINGKREGYYYVIYFNTETSKIVDLWKEYHLNEDLIRFVTLRTEKVLEKIEFKMLAQ